MRARRSVLYVPANNPGALAKAPTLKADVLIYDLEDAVLASQKETARKALAVQLSASSHKAEVFIRINRVNSSAFYDDMNWLNRQYHADGLLLPKVRSAHEITFLYELLEKQDLQLPVWIMVETIESVLELTDLVSVLKPDAAMVLGSEDLGREMRISQTPGRLGLLPVLTQLVLHARRANLTVIDAIYTNIENELGFRQACEQAKNLGFDGKSLIHPAQIDAANEVFSPGKSDIEYAKKIVKAWTQKPAHLGVISVEGQMIDSMRVRQAYEVLKIAGAEKD